MTGSLEMRSDTFPSRPSIAGPIIKTRSVHLPYYLPLSALFGRRTKFRYFQFFHFFSFYFFFLIFVWYLNSTLLVYPAGWAISDQEFIFTYFIHLGK